MPSDPLPKLYHMFVLLKFKNSLTATGPRDPVL